MLTPSKLTNGALQVHKLVIAENEAGAITRQEAVSMIPPLLLDVQPHHRVSQRCLHHCMVVMLFMILIALQMLRNAS